MKNLFLILSILLFTLTVNAQKKVKTYKVLTACGQCQLDMDSAEGCALAIQMAGKFYWVSGSSIADHGDEHAEEGMCKTKRKAEVQGTIKNDTIYVTSFVILPLKKKKKK